MFATTIFALAPPLSNPFLLVKAVYGELRRRQPQLASAALLSLAGLVPVLLAYGLDARTIHGISVWTKPAKFLVSFVVYYATLGWVFGYLPSSAQKTATGRFVVFAPLLAGLLEITWLVVAAAAGVPSHFNPSPVWAIAYGFAGLGAVVMIVAILLQGWLVARAPRGDIAPALRTALVLGAVVAFVATLTTASFLSSGSGHWFGGVPTDAGSLPLMGWSRTGGDLRVAHFWALHAQQAIPLVGLALVRFGRPNARTVVWVAAIAYVALIAFTFVQALAGDAFLAFIR
jgi:hypothetical protein